MKKLIHVLAILLFALPAYSIDLSSEALQGEWVITKVGDMDTKELDMGEDIWEFKGDQWIVKSSGVTLSPESYTVKGDKIDFGSFSITVVEFSNDKMTTDYVGIVQVLEKIK